MAIPVLNALMIPASAWSKSAYATFYVIWLFFALNVVVLREETMELKSSCLGMSTPWRLDLAAASNIFLAMAASAVILVIVMIC